MLLGEERIHKKSSFRAAQTRCAFGAFCADYDISRNINVMLYK